MARAPSPRSGEHAGPARRSALAAELGSPAHLVSETGNPRSVTSPSRLPRRRAAPRPRDAITTARARGEANGTGRVRGAGRQRDTRKVCLRDERPDGRPGLRGSPNPRARELSTKAASLRAPQCGRPRTPRPQRAPHGPCLQERSMRYWDANPKGLCTDNVSNAGCPQARRAVPRLLLVPQVCGAPRPQWGCSWRKDGALSGARRAAPSMLTSRCTTGKSPRNQELWEREGRGALEVQSRQTNSDLSTPHCEPGVRRRGT